MRRRKVDPGDALLDPIALVALALLLINDHFLKAAWPGLLTGKLSDVAGLVFFPLLLVSGWELAQAAMGRWNGPSIRPLLSAVALTAAGFVAVKTLPDAAAIYGSSIGFGQWLVSLPIHTLAGQPTGPIATAQVVGDATDLLALPAIAFALWVGVTRASAASAILTKPSLAPKRS